MLLGNNNITSLGINAIEMLPIFTNLQILEYINSFL